MSVGGVGGVSGASGAASAGAAAGAGSAPVGGASGTEGATSSPVGDASTKDISDAGDKAGNTYNMTQIQNNSMYSNMTTEQSIEIHNCVHGPEKSQCGELDIQKLLEMIMAIKLMEAMNGGSSGGFSTIA